MTIQSRALIVFAVLIADQLSKWVIMERVFRPNGVTETPFFTPFIIELLPVLNFRMAWNTGVSFSLFSDLDGPWILIALTSAIIIWLIRWLMQADTRLGAVGLAIIIGGAIGNLIDRLRFGAVADFIDVHYAGWHFPTFNLADTAITIGAIAFVIDALYGRHNSVNQDGPSKE